MSLRTVAHWVVDVIFVCAAIVMIVGLVVDGVQARSVAGAIAQLLIAVVIALLVGRIVLGHLRTTDHQRSTLT